MNPLQAVGAAITLAAAAHAISAKEAHTVLVIVGLLFLVSPKLDSALS
jgi:hypothetical protein